MNSGRRGHMRGQRARHISRVSHVRPRLVLRPQLARVRPERSLTALCRSPSRLGFAPTPSVRKQCRPQWQFGFDDFDPCATGQRCEFIHTRSCRGSTPCLTRVDLLFTPSFALSSVPTAPAPPSTASITGCIPIAVSRCVMAVSDAAADQLTVYAGTGSRRPRSTLR